MSDGSSIVAWRMVSTVWLGSNVREMLGVSSNSLILGSLPIRHAYRAHTSKGRQAKRPTGNRPAGVGVSNR